jgi:hypothetical protein
MYRYLSILLIAFLILTEGCGLSEHDLNIPDQVSPKRTKLHEIHPTTQVWIKPPAGFYLQDHLPWYTKGSDEKLRIHDPWLTGYSYIKSEYLRSYEDAISKKARPEYFYRKEFKLGNLNAFIDYYKSFENKELEYINMVFGDDQRATTIDCTFLAGDTVTRNEIVKSLLSLYLDKEIIAGPGKTINYTIDLAQSNIRFSHSIGGGIYIYSYLLPDGKKDNNIDVTLSPHFVAMDTAAMKINALKFLEDAKVVTDRPIFLNNLTGYELSFSAKIEDKFYKFLVIVISGERDGISLFAKIPLEAKEIEAEIIKVFYSITKNN